MSAHGDDGALERDAGACGPLAKAHGDGLVSQGGADGLGLGAGFDSGFVGHGILYELDQFGWGEVCYCEEMARSRRGSGVASCE